MSAQFKIELTAEAQKVLADAKTLPARMVGEVARTMNVQNGLTVGHIQTAYLSFPKDGPPVAIGLRANTNRLRGSIRASDAVISGDVIETAIGSNVAYAAAHEFGATIPAMTIYPKPGKQALRFIIGGKVVFAKKVNIGERHLPARAPIQNGIRHRLPEYGKALSAAIIKAWVN